MSAVASRWYWAQGKRQGGPVSWAELQSMCGKGKLRPDSWVIREGSQQWQPAKSAKNEVADPSATTGSTGIAPMTALPPLPGAPVAAQARAVEGDVFIPEDDAAPPDPSNGRATKRMIVGTVLVLAGILLTVASYNAASFTGGRFRIFYGLIIWGVIQWFRAMAESSGSSM